MKKALVAALLIMASVPLLIGMAAMPRQGDPDAPVHTHLSAHYLEHGAEEAGSGNIVTAVLLNYRGYDTAGEVTVIFTALVAVLAVLIVSPRGGGRGAAPAADPVPVSPVVDFIVRMLAPFTALSALYVVAHGHVTPGGGFQGGAILGGLFIVLAVVLGPERVRALLPRRVRPWLQGAGVLSFLVIGAAGASLTGSFLGFPAAAELHLAREIMMLFLEVGIGLGGAAIFASIFLQMGAE